jgi:hypothetical protein
MAAVSIPGPVHFVLYPPLKDYLFELDLFGRLDILILKLYLCQHAAHIRVVGRA